MNKKSECVCEFRTCNLSYGDRCPIYKNYFVGKDSKVTKKDWVDLKDTEWLMEWCTGRKF